MTIHITLRQNILEFPAGESLGFYLAQLDVEPESVLALRDGVLITAETILQAGDQVRIIPAITGGME